MSNNFTLYLIRHGESTRNINPNLIGQSADEPLSFLGKLQAKTLGSYFKKNSIQFNSIYSSPYKRSVDTCTRVLYDIGGTPLIDENLREYSAGDAKDKYRSDVMTPEVIKEMNDLGMAFKFPNGESLYEVEARAAIWLESTIKQAKENDVIACFSHGMTIKTLLHYIMKFDQHLTWRLSIDNTSTCHLEMKDGKWFIKTINDTRHLRDL